MDEFFRIWPIAKDRYGLERKVVSNFEEAYIRIYQDQQIIVRVDGTYDDTELLYTTAANRLLDWMDMITTS